MNSPVLLLCCWPRPALGTYSGHAGGAKDMMGCGKYQPLDGATGNMGRQEHSTWMMEDESETRMINMFVLANTVSASSLVDTTTTTSNDLRECSLPQLGRP